MNEINDKHRLSLHVSLQDSDSLRRDSFYSVASRRSTYLSAVGSSYQSLVEDKKQDIVMYGPPSTLPELSQPVPQNWNVFQGNFFFTYNGCFVPFDTVKFCGWERDV